jgi:hypothetical protein
MKTLNLRNSNLDGSFTLHTYKKEKGREEVPI